MTNTIKTSHILCLLAGLTAAGLTTVGLGSCEARHASVTFPPLPFDPSAVAVDSRGDVFIADRGNSVIVKMTPEGVLSIVAGNDNGVTPVPGPATKSPLNLPSGVAVDNQGNLYIADTYNRRVEKVTPAGILSIVAGGGNGNTPVPGPAAKSPLDGPSGVAVDNRGNLNIADAGNGVVEKVTHSGTLSIVAGNGKQGIPVLGPATKSPLGGLLGGVAVDSQGDVFIADSGNNLVEKVSSTGVLSIVAGTGKQAAPVPGLATKSPLNNPSDVAVDEQGNLYIADQGNSVVEKVTPSGILSVLVDQGSTMGTPQVVTK